MMLLMRYPAKVNLLEVVILSEAKSFAFGENLVFVASGLCTRRSLYASDAEIGRYTSRFFGRFAPSE
ncbi:MAG: hypothetical protein A2060_00070 [Planctomycetes bacterium GWA2_50_13]|nr:MAG: hypothetical protein A2060_00070 [Planctomycetes bacterium GWA2_50_13]OHB95132.1 MAG: hypothetical protein A3I59_03710 [Planctomycetes bacterium RIFCSPLOWO2_02_FULL_50_16]HCN20448.1 hypothetical protein [Planctomycetia bacterium]